MYEDETGIVRAEISDNGEVRRTRWAGPLARTPCRPPSQRAMPTR
ncbi:DUF6296 family protein [Streptomyces sp. NPDC005143]